MGAALENVFSRGHATPSIIVPDLESGSLTEMAAEQAELRENQELRALESAEAEDRPHLQMEPDAPPRAKVRQLQRPRKRPRRCDVCDKDFKSIGKMQAHRCDLIASRSGDCFFFQSADFSLRTCI